MNPRFQQVHFVGIGGIGMCGIAEVLLDLGYRVTGSDLKQTATTDRLSALGATVFVGHAQDHVHGADVVVVSSAVATENPEVRRAKALQIPVIPRAEMLGELMRIKHGVAIAGAHGKTTTTSLTASVLTDAGLDPTVVIGGRLRALGSTSRRGHSDLLVAEADESDRSFLILSPVIAVATNIDEEHMESYRDVEDLTSAFATFLNKVPFWGAAILCSDDPRLEAMHRTGQLRRRIITYGFNKEADVSADAVWTRGHESGFILVRGGHELGEIRLGLPGRHNVLNSLAAIAVALELGVPVTAIVSSLAGFSGVDRRMQVRGESRGVMVIDDYGHHPTEISATLAALKESYGRRLVCVFEPHRTSRVTRHMREFARCFGDADTVLVTQIYTAGEARSVGIDGESLAAAIQSAGHPDARFAGTVDDAATLAAEIAGNGDIVLTLGAGAVTHAADGILERLNART